MPFSLILGQFSFTLDHLGLLIERPTWRFSWTDAYGFMLERRLDDGTSQPVWAQGGFYVANDGAREPHYRPAWIAWMDQQEAGSPTGAA